MDLKDALGLIAIAVQTVILLVTPSAAKRQALAAERQAKAAVESLTAAFMQLEASAKLADAANEANRKIAARDATVALIMDLERDRDVIEQRNLVRELKAKNELIKAYDASPRAAAVRGDPWRAQPL